MAYLFSAAGSANGQVAAPLTAVPFTIALWFYPLDVSNTYALAGIWDTASATQGHILQAAGAVANDPVRAGSKAGSTAYSLAQTTAPGYSANAWSHACGVWASNTDRRAFFNGGQKGTDVTSRAPTSLDTFAAAAEIDSTPALHFDGALAEIGLWNIALKDEDVAALAAGVRPLNVQGQALIGYWPLWGRSSPALDLKGRNELTLSGSPTFQDHPRILYGVPPILGRKRTGGTVQELTVGGTLTPVGVLGPRLITTPKTGTVTPTGALVRQVIAPKTGTVTPAGALTKLVTTLKTGTLTPAGALIKALTRPPHTGTLTLAGALVKVLLPSLKTGTLTRTGALARVPVLARSGDLGLAGTLRQQPSQSLSGTLGLSGTIFTLKSFIMAVASTINFSGALRRQLNPLGLASTLPLAGTTRFLIDTAFEGEVLPQGSLAVTTSISLSGLETLSGSLFTESASALEVGGTVPLTGTVRPTPAKRVSGTLAPAGQLRWELEKNFSGYLPLEGALVIGLSVIRTFVGVITATSTLAWEVTRARFGTLPLSGLLTLGVPKSLAGTLGLTGTIELTRAQIRSFAGTVALTGALVVLPAFIRVVTGTLALTGQVRWLITKRFTGLLLSVGALITKAVGPSAITVIHLVNRTIDNSGLFSRSMGPGPEGDGLIDRRLE